MVRPLGGEQARHRQRGPDDVGMENLPLVVQDERNVEGLRQLLLGDAVLRALERSPTL